MTSNSIFIYRIYIVLLLFSFLNCSKKQLLSAGYLPTEKSVPGTGFDYQTFLHPTNTYRSHPFYSLNDELDSAELRRQILDFKQAGLGGFYLHSRGGLITPYLSDEWWRLMQTAVDAAREADLQCLFYDEDKWPSGFAGGLIPSMSEDFRAKCLARLEKNTALPTGAQLLSRDSLYQYVLYTSQFGYDIFNGTCYVDLFNPHAVQAFIESTHRPYFEKFRRLVPDQELVIFTDEPHIHARYFDPGTKHLGTLSYSPYLESKFQQLFGYSIREHLPELFEETGNWRMVRWQYYKTKALLFEESFTRQIADFCDQYGAKLTGHYLGEDDLQKVRDRIGNSSLHYRSMQQPGIDHLGLSIAHRAFTPKFLSSVANQSGKAMRMSELFGISGHNISFQERKWLGGWHAILGVNHFVPHLTAYSLKGERKRDYPPTFSYHQPYWPFNKALEDYLGRISYATAIGDYDPQVLVLSALESEYLKGKKDGEFTSGTVKILEQLQDQHIDFDLGDEEIISDIGSVKGNRFVVGKMNYRAVILPNMLTIRSSTLAKLLEFEKNGGLLFHDGSLPSLVGAQANESALRLLTAAAKPLEAAFLQNELQPSIQLKGPQADKIWLQTRQVNGNRFFLLYNTLATESADVQVQFQENAQQPVLWDPAQAATFHLQPDTQGEFSLNLSPGGFYWITTGELSRNVPAQTPQKRPENLQIYDRLNGSWNIKRHHPNAWTLDFASYSFDNGATFSEPEPVIGIWSRLNEKKYKGSLQLRFEVAVKSLPKQCSLAIEQPDAFERMLVNGKNLSFKTGAYFIDKSIQTQEISDLLKHGTNEIVLQSQFTPVDPLSSDPRKRYETELESIYLTGDFGIYSNYSLPFENTQRNQSGELDAKPSYAMEGFYMDEEKTSTTGNATLSGYPFYAGAISLTSTFDISNTARKYYLHLPKFEAIAAVVLVNQRPVDTLYSGPYTVDISSFIQAGANTLELKMVNSLRNLLGPHHHKGGELIKVGPNSFTGAGGFPDGRGEADWYELRKSRKDLAIWTDTYYHIPFGLLAPPEILVQPD